MDINELLEIALEKEKEAQKFYSDLSKKLSDAAASKLCKEFSKEEAKHVAMVQGLKANAKVFEKEDIKIDPVQDLKIGDYLQDKPTTIESDFQDILIYIMKREQKAYEFYLSLADKVKDRKTKNILDLLATEEKKHKLMVETEYDNIIYKEN